jgi:hypothetical protein
VHSLSSQEFKNSEGNGSASFRLHFKCQTATSDVYKTILDSTVNLVETKLDASAGF